MNRNRSAVVAVLAVALTAMPQAAAAFTPAPVGERDAIARYYGDDGSGRADRVDSPYIRAVGRIVDRELPRLQQRCAAPGNPAIVVDVDNTMLLTYDLHVGIMDYELDRALKRRWIDRGRFPAVPSMVRLVTEAEQSGCRILVVTGRPASTEKATTANLTKLGYPRPDRFRGKPADCDCTTQQFKTRTRAAFERNGFDIIANLGDQRGDLVGGHSGRRIRIPNPMYTAD